MKTVSKQVRLGLTVTQGGANTDGVSNTEVDPFDRGDGFLLRAILFRLDPTKLADIAADASVQIQVYASTDAIPTGEYAVSDKHVIASYSFAVALTTSGVGVIPAEHRWDAPDGSLIIGAANIGIIAASAGCTSALVAAAELFGDSVSLTTEEIALSRERFT